MKLLQKWLEFVEADEEEQESMLSEQQLAGTSTQNDELVIVEPDDNFTRVRSYRCLSVFMQLVVFESFYIIKLCLYFFIVPYNFYVLISNLQLRRKGTKARTFATLDGNPRKRYMRIDANLRDLLAHQHLPWVRRAQRWPFTSIQTRRARCRA